MGGIRLLLVRIAVCGHNGGVEGTMVLNFGGVSAKRNGQSRDGDVHLAADCSPALLFNDERQPGHWQVRIRNHDVHLPLLP